MITVYFLRTSYIATETNRYPRDQTLPPEDYESFPAMFCFLFFPIRLLSTHILLSLAGVILTTANHLLIPLVIWLCVHDQTPSELLTMLLAVICLLIFSRIQVITPGKHYNARQWWRAKTLEANLLKVISNFKGLLDSEIFHIDIYALDIFS